jgi:LysM repeat protein
MLPAFAGFVVAVVLIAGGIMGLILFRHFRRAAPSARQPMLQVTLTRPAGMTSWPDNAYIPVLATIISTDPVNSVEFWVDGALADTKGVPAGADPHAFFVQWSWPPGKTGSHVLLVRAKDTKGKVGVSKVVQITATDPVGSLLLVTAQPGETYQSLADANHVTLQQIGQNNPKLDLKQPLQAGQKLFIPLPPELAQFITSTPSPSGGGQAGNNPPNPAPGPQVSPTPTQAVPSPNQGIPPNTPEPTISIKDCNIHLWLGNMEYASNEVGLHVYRSDPSTNGNFTLVASLPVPPPGTQDWPDPNKPTLAGTYSYIVGGYNQAGESQSKPIWVDYDAPTCLPAGTNGLNMADGILTMPESVDLGYLYVTVGKHSDRIPGGSRSFLNGSGYKFDLRGYLDQMVDEIPDGTFTVTIEVWGWQAGKLIYVGKIVQTYHDYTKLLVCSQEGASGCTSGGNWVTDVLLTDTFPPKPLKDRVFNFKWSSSVSYTNGYVWQVAAAPCPSDGIRDASELIFSADDWMDTGVHNFSLPFSVLFKFNDPPRGSGSWIPYDGDSFQSDWFASQYIPGTPFTLYIRAVPKGPQYGQMSNTVTVRYLQPKPTPPPVPLTPTLPDIYDIKILPDSYTPPVLVDPSQWGCVVKLSDNTIHCPGPYTPPGNWDFGALAKQLGHEIVQAFDALATLFDTLKSTIVGAVAKLIGCKEGSACYNVLYTALNTGITALTGLPPSIPNFDQLASQGIAYIAESTVSDLADVNTPCDTDCQNAITGQLQNLVAEALASNPAPGCVDEETAHQHKKEVLCPKYPWKPAPGSIFQPATFKVQVTRKAVDVPHPGGASQATHDQAKLYGLKIQVKGVNSARTGQWINFCGYQEEDVGNLGTGYTGEGVGYPRSIQITGAMEGDFYLPQEMKIPWLEPGKSVVVPIFATRKQYWYGDHEYDWYQDFDAGGDEAFAACGDDWPYLYYRGYTTINAIEVCQSNVPDKVFCGSSDSLTFKDPSPP